MSQETVPRPSDNLHVIVTGLDLCVGQTDAVALGHLLRREARMLGAPALIVIDTLARSMGGGDENSGPDMARLVSHLGIIQAMTAATVLAVHHTGKDPERGARGHSLLRAAVDTEIELTCKDGVARAHTRKQRDLEGGRAVTFKLEQVVLGEVPDEVPERIARGRAEDGLEGAYELPRLERLREGRRRGHGPGGGVR